MNHQYADDTQIYLSELSDVQPQRQPIGPLICQSNTNQCFSQKVNMFITVQTTLNWKRFSYTLLLSEASLKLEHSTDG